MAANNRFIGTCYICGEVNHRSSDHIDRGRHQSRHSMRRYGGHGGGHHADSRQGDRHVDHRQGHGGARPGNARQEGARHVEDFHERGGDQHRVRFSSDGNDDWRHARAAPAIGYHHCDQFNHTNSSSDDDQFDRAASAIVAAFHIGNKFHSQTVVVDFDATRHIFTICPSSTSSSLSHPRLSSWATTRQPTVLRLVRLCSTCLTGVVFAFPKSFM
jgi:hypothetical protein